MLATSFKRLISLHGAPRSGTSWLGKVFDSHPDVAYRFQPLFSYRFKGAIDVDTKPQEVQSFLQRLYEVADDEFILQRPQLARGAHPVGFEKRYPSSVMVMKEVRYHYIIPALLRSVPGVKVVGIVRHPCGVINSWLKTPREFKPGWDPESEWREAPSKNQGRREEYYGFSKWKELTRWFLELERLHPDAFLLMRYESLVTHPQEQVRKLFAFCNLDMPIQVIEFLQHSQETEVEDPDTVFRLPEVADRWKRELPANIRDAIFSELRGSDLETFL